MDNGIKATEKLFSFQKKAWLISRIAWFVLGLIIIASLFGLFGNGMLSEKTFAGNGIMIKYNIFMRVTKNSEIVVQVPNLGNNVQVSINNDYLNKVIIDQVTPAPVAVEINNNKLVYTFQRLQQGFLTFYLTPKKIGWHHLEISINGRKMRAYQYIYL